MPKQTLKKVGLVAVGASLGVMVSVSLHLYADKSATPPAASATANSSDNLPVNELNEFVQVFGRIKQSYVEPVEDKKLIKEAINGMLTGLDPHSTYLDEEAFKELTEETKGEFGGLGMEVGMEDGLVKVTAPIDDTPAFRAGIKSGDYIVKLDDTPVKGLTLDDAVKKMRGKPDTSITLTIFRKSESKPIVMTLKRAIIKVASVKSRLLESNYGYVRLTQFKERSTEDVAKAIDALYKQNKTPLKGLVLDLRNDPGGLLTSAVGVSSIFLPEKSLVVYTDGRTEDAKAKFYANREFYDPRPSIGSVDPVKIAPAAVKNVPLVILVNGGTASASEIVSGALQDHKRAIVVGTQTFGKGSVQTVLPLGPKSAIKLTTARYFTPNGRSIQAEGIKPDVEAKEGTLKTDEDQDALRIREADLEHHLNNPNSDKPASEAKTPLIPPVKSGDAAKAAASVDESQATRDKNDYQLQQALNVLKVQQILLKK
ncbi:S41 family peptidase [Leeia sp. TBRC 13508]|uniref:S41 family peptidase n=1 Tax=Leeia speluncae TaxID=2884804 RepID=A0ABS8D5T4_9NEIS|nr:S41 family peptidase [Leeia speluncae]MCB6183527.1 S41 family peptidase [Leeia speluncae]